MRSSRVLANTLACQAVESSGLKRVRGAARCPAAGQNLEQRPRAVLPPGPRSLQREGPRAGAHGSNPRGSRRKHLTTFSLSPRCKARVKCPPGTERTALSQEGESPSLFQERFRDRDAMQVSKGFIFLIIYTLHLPILGWPSLLSPLNPLSRSSPPTKIFH